MCREEKISFLWILEHSENDHRKNTTQDRLRIIARDFSFIVLPPDNQAKQTQDSFLQHGDLEIVWWNLLPNEATSENIAILLPCVTLVQAVHIP
jgi:hypothetical protein